MIRHFSQEPFEGTFYIEYADLQKMMNVLADVNIEKCPYFDLSDKYGNSARYYRDNQWIPVSESHKGKWIDSGYGVECSLCGEWYPHASIARNQLNFCPNCGADMREKKKTLNEIRAEYGLPPINERGEIMDSNTTIEHDPCKVIENEAWKLANYMCSMSRPERYLCFGFELTTEVTANMSYQEAKDKFEEWLRGDSDETD